MRPSPRANPIAYLTIGIQFPSASPSLGTDTGARDSREEPITPVLDAQREMKNTVLARVRQIRMCELLLAGTAVVQVASLLIGVRALAQKVGEWQGVPAVERSVRIAFGDDFEALVTFLRTRIPEDGRLVIPPMDLDATLGNVGLVQYFLFPREIVNCPSGDDLPACVRSLTGAQTCILRIGDFPPQEDVPSTKMYIPFDEERGLYCPP